MGTLNDCSRRRAPQPAIDPPAARVTRWLQAGVALAILFASPAAQPAAVEADLAEALRSAPAGERLRVIVELRAQAAPEAAAAGETDRRARAAAIIRALRATAARTQEPVLRSVREAEARGAAAGVRSYWLANAFAAQLEPAAVRELMANPQVARVYLDRVQTLPPAAVGADQPAVAAVEWGVDRIRAPLVWEYFGQRGAGAVVGVIDTGFDPGHPDLQNWAGAWRDAVNGLPDPYDDNAGVWHGTHVTGTSVGGSAGGTAIGVAPEATFISCKAFSASGRAWNSDLLECMEWMADPDGNPDTADQPDVVNNSWGGSPLCLGIFRTAVRVWWALDIFPNFAAGNTGPAPRTGGIPGAYSESFAVGATDLQDNIADFSSRGPSRCDETVFPEVSAPGVDIRSARGGGGYLSLNGTSMATPHVTGCVALMRARNPDLPVASIWWLLRRFAVDRGPAGADNDYGAGRLDCLLPAAYAGP